MKIINEETQSMIELLNSNKINNECFAAKLTNFFLGNKIRYKWECNSS